MNENTNNKPENPKAFPNVDPNFFGANDSHGMDLRDYFAGLAMQSILLATKDSLTITPIMVAQESYTIADAMLTEREKTK